MKHTLSVLVENTPGILTRVAGLFARRGFNIDSISAGVTENPHYTRMTIVVDAQDQPLEQITKQLHKLINVLKITDLDPNTSVDRELVLIKVKADASSRGEIIQIVEVFGGKILSVTPSTLVLEVTGGRDDIESIMTMMRPFGIIEIVRTGKIAMGKSPKAT